MSLSWKTHPVSRIAWPRRGPRLALPLSSPLHLRPSCLQFYLPTLKRHRRPQPPHLPQEENPLPPMAPSVTWLIRTAHRLLPLMSLLPSTSRVWATTRTTALSIMGLAPFSNPSWREDPATHVPWLFIVSPQPTYSANIAASSTHRWACYWALRGLLSQMRRAMKGAIRKIHPRRGSSS